MPKEMMNRGNGRGRPEMPLNENQTTTENS